MNYSFKNKLSHYVIIIISLLFINISCKEKTVTNKIAFKNQENLTQKNRIIDSCSIFDKHISIKENESKVISIKLDTISTKKIILSKLNFPFQKISNINLNCSKNNKFQVLFNENVGNSYYTTYHLFKFDSISKEYRWHKIYKVESTRQGFSIIGANLKKQKTFKNYDAQESEDLAFLQIYSFTGFQENKSPTIKPFYNKIKSLTKIQDKKIDLYGNEFVLEYLTQKNVINNENLSQFNDIGYYLWQSNLYDGAIFLLEKIINKFPNRTVAYLNLGDAYWGNNEKEKAKKMYKIYIKQMKEKRKETKIPKQVLLKIE